MPAIIGALVAALITGLRTYLPGIVGRILLTLGIGFTAYKIALPPLIAMASEYIDRLPIVARVYFGALGLDIALVMILSALVAVRAQRMVMTKLGAGT